MSFQGEQRDSRVPVLCRKKKRKHIIPEHDDLNHVICDLDGIDGHDTKYEIRFSQITVNLSSSEKLT